MEAKPFLRKEGNYNVYRMQRRSLGPTVRKNFPLSPPLPPTGLVDVLWYDGDDFKTGHVDPAPWVRGEQQTIAGITLPAEMTD